MKSDYYQEQNFIGAISNLPLAKINPYLKLQEISPPESRQSFVRVKNRYMHTSSESKLRFNNHIGDKVLSNPMAIHFSGR